MIFEKVSDLLAEKLECEASTIKMETEFAELGIDSLDITELVMSLEDDLNIEISVDQDTKTVGDLVASIEAKI